MNTYELWSVLIAGLTLFALLGSLWVLIGYAKDTATLAKCAVDQTPRPCVSVLQLPDQSTMALFESVSTSIDGLNTVVLVNIGTTRAINVRFWIGPVASTEDRDFTTGAPIECGGRFDTGHPVKALQDPALVVVEYESVGGTGFRSETMIEARKWVRSARFLPA
ncbi:MAG: hypothetical protein NTV05_05660 [Acidobacteria bacterium]|nr:hypothetical protein [Acidobacteriota bacterium]